MSRAFPGDRQPWQRWLRALAILAALAFARPASAQLRACPQVAKGNDLKVVLDTVYYDPPGSAGQDAKLMRRLTAKLESQLSTIQSEVGTVAEVVLCTGRRPSAASQFTRAQTDAFNTSRVVLEVWGTVEPRSAASAVSGAQATVGFVVIPVRFYEFFVNTDPATRMPGVYTADYTVTTNSLANLLSQSHDFQAYVAVGIGLKLLLERSYDAAKKAFCRAQYFLQPGAAAPADPDQRTLLEYARRMTDTTFQRALASPTYRGALKAIDPKIAGACAR